MKSFGLGVAAIVLGSLTAPAMAAEVDIPPARVTYIGGTSPLPSNLTPCVGPAAPGCNTQARVYDFTTNNEFAGTFTQTSGNVRPGVFSGAGESNVAARPAFNLNGPDGDPNTADDLNFAGVGGGQTYTLTFGSAVQVLSFVVGSLDTYNYVTFTYDMGNDVTNTTTLNGYEIFYGSTNVIDVPNSGSQSLDVTNGRVIYDLGGLPDFGRGIVSVVFGSGQNAFEFGQIATAAPEPGTWGMMIFGFGIAGVALRARRRDKRLATA